MAFPIALLLAGLQYVGSTQGKQREADRLARAQRKFEKLNAQYTAADLVSNYGALSARRLEERRVLTDSVEQLTRDAERRIGSAVVSRSEAGVGGHTAAAVINDFKISQLTSEQNLIDTERFAQAQFERESQALKTRAEERIAMAEQPRPQVSYMQDFLTFTSSVINGWRMEQSLQPKYGSGDLKVPNPPKPAAAQPNQPNIPSY